MGTWGSGNFDGDDPREFLADMVGRWERIVDRTLAGESTEETAGFGWTPGFEAVDGCVMPAVEILIAVAERLPCDHLPGPGKVAEWSTAALKIFDEQVDQFDPEEEYKVERRAIVGATFARLAKLVEGREDEEATDP